MIPTHAEFRKVGKTGNARNYPYSPRALSVLAEWNGGNVDRMPETFKWAANYRMQAWMDMLGAAKEAGKTYKRDGVYLTPSKLLEAAS